MNASSPDRLVNDGLIQLPPYVREFAAAGHLAVF
jgi:hypothetical protein